VALDDPRGDRPESRLSDPANTSASAAGSGYVPTRTSSPATAEARGSAPQSNIPGMDGVDVGDLSTNAAGSLPTTAESIADALSHHPSEIPAMAAEANLALLAREFTALAQSLLRASTVAGVLSRVVETAIAVVPGADLVSVTLRTSDGRFATPVETDELASALDEIQYSANEGPCVDATRTEGLGVTSCPDLKAGSPWPVFGPKAADLGVRAVFGAGLFPDADPPRMGALNFYSYKANGLDGVDQDIALLLAAHASVALAGTKAVTAAELEAAQLRQALESRDVIGQAKGILMQRRGVSADEAFAILRDASQSLNMKLADIARTVAARRRDL
jgi:ANTAR domain